MSREYDGLAEYVGVVTKLDDADLGAMYRTLEGVVRGYMDREDVSEDVTDDYEILTMYFERLDDLMKVARELDVKKEQKFLIDNVALFGHFDGEDRIVMLISLLTVSLTRLRDKIFRY